MPNYINHVHCEKSVRIRYSVRMWENTAQKNSEHGHFSRSDKLYKDMQKRTTYTNIC